MVSGRDQKNRSDGEGDIPPHFQCYTWRGRVSVNHCSLHSRLAKIRGLMRRVKYDDVIGQKTRFLYLPSMNYQAMGFFSASHSAVLNPSHQITDFHQTTV